MIAEAMAYKKPIVATHVGGIPELVAEGESGYLVERDNPTAAAERLFNLLRDSDLRHKMGAEGYRRVHATFNLRQNVEQLISSYQL